MEKTFKTFDGVEVSLSNDVWYCYKTGINVITNNKDIPTMFYINKVANNYDFFYYFSTQEACQQYIDKMSQPVIFTTADGVDMREDDEYYYIEIDNLSIVPIENAKKFIMYNRTTTGSGINSELIYFSTFQKTEEYIDSLKPIESTVVEPNGPIIIELSKSELEIAYDTLVALCAKYRQDNATVKINTFSSYPNGVTKYNILLESDGHTIFTSTSTVYLDEAVVITHAWLINNRHFNG